MQELAAIGLLRSSFATLKTRFQAVDDPHSPCKALLVERHGDGESPIRKYINGFNTSEKFGSILGSPIIRPALMRIHRTDPTKNEVLREMLQRSVQVQVTTALDSLNRDAAELLFSLPLPLQIRLWETLPNEAIVSRNKHAWVAAVFELAWQSHAYSPLRADRGIPVAADMTIGLHPRLSTAESIAAVKTTEFGPSIDFDTISSDPDWYAMIDNFAAASVQAIDILLSWIDAAPTAPTTTPSGTNDKSKRTAGKPSTNAVEQSGKESKPKRGRRKGSVATDLKRDQQIADAWAKGFGAFASHEELANAFGIQKSEVTAALDRHRKRLPSEIISNEKRRQGQ